MRFRRGEVAWELREVEAVLKVEAVGVERVWGGGSAAGWSSPAFGVSGGGVLGRGVRELAKRGGEKSAGLLVVLRRAKDRELGLWFGLSTAAARWRPPGRFWARRGRVARGGGSSARQQEGEELAGDAWEPAHGELMAGKAGKASAGGAVGGRRREAEQGGGDGHKGDFAISKSSRDLSVNKQ